MCEDKAVGREHAPPKCLFPKSKDTNPELNFRINLRTVPSCSLHNSEKSGEDIYFLNVITSCNLINEVGMKHYRQQIRRQNIRNPSIIHRFAKRAVDIDGQLGHRIEIDRLDNFINHLARALYFDHFFSEWNDTIEWFPEFLVRPKNSIEEVERLSLIKKNDSDFSKADFHGSNPEVFKYQVIEDGEHTKLRMYFYEGCKILLIF